MINIDINRIVPVVKNALNGVSLPSVNTTALLSSLNPTLKNLNANTLPGRAMETKFTAGFTSTFPITLQGLGFMTAGAGINSNQVMTIAANGFNIAPGSNSVDLSSRIAFPRIDGTPETVAAFVDDVMKNPGATSESLFGNGVAFGFDEAHAFKLFSKATVSIPSKWVVNNQTIDAGKRLAGSLDVKSLLSGIFLNKAYLSVSPESVFNTEIVGGMSNVSFTAQASVGYAHAITLLDNHP